MNRVVILGAALAGLVATVPGSFKEDWKSDWAVDGPFALEVDASGFSLPTAIAFVDDPGDRPDDPLYFVVELTGAIKAVTNDRSVLDFASVPTVDPEADLPNPSAQLGAAGICLEPEHGYVFVTFVSMRDGGTLGNRVMRFTTKPRVFGTAHSEAKEIAPILGETQSAPSHQIGGCAIDGGHLYVGIGDGRDISAASRKEDLLGKVVAMDLDGRPLQANPFAADESEAAQYVFAMGLRNPFAIGVYEGLITVIDNGLSIDRLILAEPGVDYLWDGSDDSIEASATAVIDPGPGVVHLDRSDPAGPLGDGILYSASAADQGLSGLWFLPFDFESGHTIGTARQLVQFVGEDYSPVTGLAQGPDGIYFTPLTPIDGDISVMKLVHRPSEPHPIAIEPRQQNLFTELGCITCHERDGAGGDVGPSLDFFHHDNRERVLSMIESDGFEEALRALDERTDEPFVSTRDARAEVLSDSGLARLHSYIKNKALEPRFSDPNAVMPQLGLSEEQAAAVASELASPWEIRVSRLERALRTWFPLPETRLGDLIAGGIMGGAVVGTAVGTIILVRRLKRRRTLS